MGVGPPISSEVEVLPSDVVFTASRLSPWPGKALQDKTSVSSTAVGGEARGGVSLSPIPGSSEFPEDEDRWRWALAGLQRMI